jgi:peptidyl-prolyl cis-trans isomerase SurA
MPPRPDLLGEVLERLVMERVQTQAAQDAGIKVTDQEVDRAIESVAQQNKMSATELRSRVEASGMSWTKYRDELRKQVQVIRLREREVDSKVQVYDGEIDNYLAARGGQAAARPDRVQCAADPRARARRCVRCTEGPAQGQGRRPAQAGAGRGGLCRTGQGQLRGAGSVARRLAGFPRDWPPAGAVRQCRGRPATGRVVPEVLESANGFHVLKLVSKRTAAAQPAASDRITQTQVRHILIRTGPNMPEAEAKRQMATIRDRITHGGDFADAARRYSQDGSASQGGELGWVSPGELVPEFEQAMNRLRPGEISDPVVTQFGVHLIQVENRRETEVSPEKQRDFARAEVREQKLRAAYDDWVRQLRSAAYVEYRINRQR